MSSLSVRTHFSANQFELLFRSQSVGRDRREVRIKLPLQTADALHVKFVEIRMKDIEETNALKDRIALVFCLKEHAFIKFQNAKLAI